MTTTPASTGEYPEKARIVVVGAGAIGGLLGVHLSRSGHAVTFVARGAHLAAMQEEGALRLVCPDGSEVRSAEGSEFVGSVRECGGGEKPDVVILGLKTPQIRAVVNDVAAVIGERTVILTTQNGVPWWYFQRYSQGPVEYCDRVIESVDPGGVLSARLDAGRLLPLVVYPSSVVLAPGVVTHNEGVRFPVGELDGRVDTQRVQWISKMLINAGFKSPILPDVRAELWLKLWGTVAVNPLSALTHATLDDLCAPNSPARPAVQRVMREVEQVANALGATMRVPMQRRIDGAAAVGKHRTSMLQDIEHGRTPEIDTIITAVVELARLTNVPVPATETVADTLGMLVATMRATHTKICPIAVDDQ